MGNVGLGIVGQKNSIGTSIGSSERRTGRFDVRAIGPSQHIGWVQTAQVIGRDITPLQLLVVHFMYVCKMTLVGYGRLTATRR